MRLERSLREIVAFWIDREAARRFIQSSEHGMSLLGGSALIGEHGRTLQSLLQFERTFPESPQGSLAATGWR